MGIHVEIAKGMPPLSHLECMECGRKKPVGDVPTRMAYGWPKCCGYTMRLFTQRETAERGQHE